MIGLGIIAIWLFRKKHLLSYCIFFFFLSISMYANLIKPPPGIVAERFLCCFTCVFTGTARTRVYALQD